MDIGVALYNILSNNAGVAAVVSDRVFPIHSVQTGVKPFVTYQKFRPRPTKVKDGPSPLDIYTVQVNSIAENITDAMALADIVRTALDFVSGIYGGINVQFISYQGGTDSYDDNANYEGAQMVMDDYLIRVVR